MLGLAVKAPAPKNLGHIRAMKEPTLREENNPNSEGPSIFRGCLAVFRMILMVMVDLVTNVYNLPQADSFRNAVSSPPTSDLYPVSPKY